MTKKELYEKIRSVILAIHELEDEATNLFKEHRSKTGEKDESLLMAAITLSTMKNEGFSVLKAFKE